MEMPMSIYIDPPGGGGKTAATSSSKTLSSSFSSMKPTTDPVGGNHNTPPSSHDPQGATAASPPAAPCLIPPRRFTPDGRVTSVDLTPDGAYVIAGCSDGTIRLYSMLDSSWGREGLLLGQIHAKGLITNLIFHVEVAGDGRFAFAGVLRGSVEMFAYDLTRLPKGPWGDDDTNSLRGNQQGHRLSKAEAETLIECHTNLDAKLRGFGAVSRMSPSSSSFRTGHEMDLDKEQPEYRLICGLGIKNLHIWRFQEGLGGEDAVPIWECIFDLASNGMSIELLAVRAGGLEAVSKSCGQNLRVWDLSSAEEKEKAPYTDVLNTQDTRAVFGDYAFGGTCQLSLVRLDACKQLNRMELPLPTTVSTQPPSGGKAKRRQLCSVKDVVGTHGGAGQAGRVLIVCSDGGVHCYENTEASSATGRLVPVHSLTVDDDDDVTLNLASVGKGERLSPVVLQTRWLSGESCGEIYVAPLQLTQPKEEAVAIRRKALGQLDQNRLLDGSASASGMIKAKVGVAKGLSSSSKSSSSNNSNSSTSSTSSTSAGNGSSGGNDAPASIGKGGAGLIVFPSNSNNHRADSPPVAHPVIQSKKPAAKKRAKSLPGGKSLPYGSESSGNSKANVAVAATGAAITAARKEIENAPAAALQLGPLLLCKPLPVSRPPLLLPSAPPTILTSGGKVPASYYPIKRKHYDPFAAMYKPKRGKNHLEGPPRAMRDLEAKRLTEDGGSKTQEFFKERVARQETLRYMRVAMEQQARQVRFAATMTVTSDSKEGGNEEGSEGEAEWRQASSMVDRKSFSTIMTWGELREKHRRDKENLSTKFLAEHDWLRSRFLEAVERERLLFHIHKHALPSSVRDPLGFLWWHDSRLPIKKQWGRYRAFPQQSLEVQALTGLSDVSGRRFSLSGIIANYKDLVARTVRRQQVEADTLAALQSMDLPFTRPSALKVVYPYVADFSVQDPVGERRKEEQGEAATAKAREASTVATVAKVAVIEAVSA
ncbi:Hypothetical protein NocV09_00502840 [Nannochloropsis oceanica]